MTPTIFSPRLAAGAASLAAVVIAATGYVAPATAQETLPVSQCQAIANNLSGLVHFAHYEAGESHDHVWPAQDNREDVRLTFIGHSTYLIETPGGVRIATDYNGFSGPPDPPTVVTMNKAHSTHYTNAPDPAIEHVLRGWNPAGGPADHDIVVGDTYVRNVPTDIRVGYEMMEADGNSIFVFEVAGLCIGHLGHLHHIPTDEDFAEIGRLDVVMVPTDGGLTLGVDQMYEVVERLRSSVILPMHRFGPSLDRFMALFDESFARDVLPERSITVSLRSLPDRPTIYILQGM